MDCLANEPQFLDHLAPVWRLLPPSSRGRFLVDPSLVDRARARGIEAVPQERPPHTVAMPKPNPGWNPALVASYGDVKEGRRLGYGPFAFLEHGIGQTYLPDRGQVRGHASYSGGLDREDNELVLVPNEHAAAAWRASYAGARVEVVGCPKLDDLPRKERADPPVICLTWHWPAPLSISGYAGTALGDYLDQLPKLAAAFPGHVIGTAHPKADWPERMKRTYARAGIPFVADFEEVCRQADLLVFDNTSAGYEFAATGRPVVVLNARYWSRKQSHGLRFWEAAGVGVNVNPGDDLVAKVREALEDAPERQEDREEALQIVYGRRSGGAQAAAAAITDWLGQRVEVAA